MRPNLNFRVLLGLILFLLYVPTAFAWENAWFSIGLNSDLKMALTKEPRFDLKPQLDGGLGLSLEFTPFTFLGIGVAYSYHWTGTSSIEGGYIYRAHFGSELRLFLALRYIDLAQSENFALLFGSYQGALGRFDRYDLSTLHFFYAGIFMQPFLELGLGPFPQSSFQFSLPLSLYFRQDLEFSATIGLGFSFILSPFRKKWK